MNECLIMTGYSGLPPWHKYVAEQGYPPEEVEAAIKNSTRLMIERGYNVKSMSLLPDLKRLSLFVFCFTHADLHSVPCRP